MSEDPLKEFPEILINEIERVTAFLLIILCLLGLISAGF